MSTTPSKDTIKRSLARHLRIPGYKRSAVQMRSTYSTQKINSVMTSTTKKKPDRKSSSSNVCKNVTRILETIVIVIKISNARLIRLLLSPIWIMLNIFSLTL